MTSSLLRREKTSASPSGATTRSSRAAASPPSPPPPAQRGGATAPPRAPIASPSGATTRSIRAAASSPAPRGRATASGPTTTAWWTWPSPGRMGTAAAEVKAGGGGVPGARGREGELVLRASGFGEGVPLAPAAGGGSLAAELSFDAPRMPVGVGPDSPAPLGMSISGDGAVNFAAWKGEKKRRKEKGEEGERGEEED
uniref:Uncharacterized protein n=1 Tax=Oryza meridionalis TaxID=40149 RepID=A0A0E0CWG4_9ORYZ